MKPIFLLSLFLCFAAAVHAPASAGRRRQAAHPRGARYWPSKAKTPFRKVASLLSDPDVGVRVEAVKALIQIGGPKTLDGLVRAAADNDAEVQIRATDGLVNVYLPGYVKTGLSGRISRAGASVTAKFTDTNDQVIDPFVQVRPDVIVALGKLARGAASLDARANAARAVGVLRGRAAIPDLIEALRSKDDKLMYESLVAIQKIGDPAVGPAHQFPAGRSGGKNSSAGAGDHRPAAQSGRRAEGARRSGACADRESTARGARSAGHDRRSGGPCHLPAESFRQRRPGAGGGRGGLGPAEESDGPIGAESGVRDEHGMNPRLSAAFALVMLGALKTDRYGPLQYLLNSVNQRAWRGVAVAFLTELAREQPIRQTIYGMLGTATKDEKIQLSIVLARSGDKDSIPSLEALSKDPDPDVAAEGIRSLRVLRARLP